MNEQLQALLDRAEIEAVMHRYIRGLDRADWQMVASAYHPDASDEHGDYRGSAAGFIDSLKARHKHVEQSLHFISNIVIEFVRADKAIVESCFLGYQRVQPAVGSSRLNYVTQVPLQPDDVIQTEIAGRYVDVVTRRHGAWRIQERTTVFEVYQASPVPAGGKLKPTWTLPMRDGTDLIQRKRRELGR